MDSIRVLKFDLVQLYRELQVEPLGLKEWDLVQKWEIATIECLIFLALKNLQVFGELTIIILRWIEEIHVNDVKKNYAEQS
jgi:hypothetical protein